MRFCALLLLLACTTVPKVSPERLAAVHQAEDEDALKGCKRLGRFTGSSTQAGDPGLAQARTEARAKCADAGATDFAFVNESVTPDVTTVAAIAYDCAGRR
ncbi:MAG TPA: hypothetical protein VI356_21505 [Myxococcales bacterium]|nr:hypothetical protein [Myxococcales bacterium]